MNAQKINEFLADWWGGWTYDDVQETENWWEEQRKRYNWYKAQLGSSKLSFYNPRVEEDYDRARLYMEHFRDGLRRISAGQPTDPSALGLYWDLAQFSIQALDNELDILYGMYASGLVTLLKVLPTSKYKAALDRLQKEIPVLEGELKKLEQDAKETGYQLLCSGVIMAVTNLLPPARAASIAVKAIGMVASPMIDNALGGDKSSAGMEALDGTLDYGVTPALVAIEGLEFKVKDGKSLAAARIQKAGKVAKVGAPFGDLLGAWCDLDEAWAAHNRADLKRQQLNKAVAEMRKTLNELEDARVATYNYRMGAAAKLAEAERKMADSREAAEESRDEVWEMEYDNGVTEYDTPVWY